MTTTVCAPTLAPSALDVLRQAGNPFRNYFARNPDDEVCARFHVPELFARERAQLLGVVELYRAAPETPSEMVPILGNKGAGKTHLLHSIKHGQDGAWQLLVTPGTFQKDTDFMEYLLFQVIDTLLSGGKQKGRRPLEHLGEALTRRQLQQALSASSRDEQMDLFPAPGLGRWARRLGLGSSQAHERTQWVMDRLASPELAPGGLRRLCADCHLDGERACELILRHIDRTEPRSTLGLMRRHLAQGFSRAALVGDESDLANFLTYGFAELDVKVQPSRQDLVLSLFKALMEVFQGLRVPVVVAFDQLEDLLLARRSEDGHRIAETFFAGIVHAMHQLSGVCFLVFAERGLWNRFVPSLDGYIQDRLNNPIHVPGHGSLKALRLEAPPVELVRRVAQARLRPTLAALPDAESLPDVYPFTPEQVTQVAHTEPTLRDMLQQFRHLYDHLVFGEVSRGMFDSEAQPMRVDAPAAESPMKVKSVVIVDAQQPAAPVEVPAVSLPAVVPAAQMPVADAPMAAFEPSGSLNLEETWEREMQAALEKLRPEGAVTGATRELQAGLGTFLATCHEHGVKVGPWRTQHIVADWNFGEHPTYGTIAIAHWKCRDGQPWKVGIGLFLGRGVGKPKDLEVKLASLSATPPMIDHLILLRPADDIALTGKSKTLWQEMEKRGQHARLEPMTTDDLAILYGFPRWLTVVREALPAGAPMPNLADLIQERCEKLLEQVCMPLCP